MRMPGERRQFAAGAAALRVKGEWQKVLSGEGRGSLERRLADYLPRVRWFGSKARTIATTRLVEAFALPGSGAFLTLIRVHYSDQARETYLLPLAFASGDRAEALERESPDAVVSRLTSVLPNRVSPGVVYDAVFDGSLGPALLAAIARRRRLKGLTGVARGSRTPALARLWRGGDAPACRLIGREQSNTSMLFGDRLMLKLIRKIESGVNPELEIGRFLARRSSRANVPPLAGALEYHRDAGEPATLAILQGFVANQGDAWSYTLDWLERFFQGVSRGRKLEPAPTADVLSLSAQEPSSETRAALGDYLESARLLGRRTAELHLALGGRSSDPSFTPEPFTASYRGSLNRSLRNLTAQVFGQLRERLSLLPAGVRAGVERVLAREAELVQRFSELGERELSGRRIRGHGDYHLGQVLYTGEDFVIIDFEGEPARPLRERRIKHSPLRDVAGMLRSFHYAAYARLAGARGAATARVEDFVRLEPAARSWYLWSSAAFLSAYLDVAHPAGLLPRSRAELSFLLEILILEKAIYELGYELNHRPAWLKIPTQAVLEALEPKATEAGRDVPPRAGQDGEVK